MKKIRLFLIAAATTLTLVAGLTPVASARGFHDPPRSTTEHVRQFDCRILHGALVGSATALPETTRSELAQILNNTPDLGIISDQLQGISPFYSGLLADRALECRIVREDLQVPSPAENIHVYLTSLLSS